MFSLKHRAPFFHGEGFVDEADGSEARAILSPAY
jgi:hypothetical protein